jgi:hypothetical protein
VFIEDSMMLAREALVLSDRSRSACSLESAAEVLKRSVHGVNFQELLRVCDTRSYEVER